MSVKKEKQVYLIYDKDFPVYEIEKSEKSEKKVYPTSENSLPGSRTFGKLLIIYVDPRE